MMKLFSRKFGSGPPLVILHGLYGSSDNWVSIARILGNSFTVYLPDLRNHGQSPHSPVHNYEAMAADIHEFAATENLKRFFLAGHSMGGKCAVSFALQWPELLTGLLVADVSPFRDNRSLDSEYEFHNHILATINNTDTGLIKSRGDAEKLLSESIEDESVRGFILKNLRREPDNTFSWKLNAKVLLENLGRITEAVGTSHNFNDQAGGFPVIFIKGELSNYLPEEDYPGIRNIFPSAEFYTIPGAGHWVHADNPEEVIKNFIRLLEAAS